MVVVPLVDCIIFREKERSIQRKYKMSPIIDLFHFTVFILKSCPRQTRRTTLDELVQLLEDGPAPGPYLPNQDMHQ